MFNTKSKWARIAIQLALHVLSKTKKKLAMHANNSWQYIYHIPLPALISTIHGSNTVANQLIDNDIKKFKQYIDR